MEKWLLRVQEVMILSLKDVMKESFEAYAKDLRESWVLDWPGQVRKNCQFLPQVVHILL